MLGEAPTHYIKQLNADAQPWYLRPNYDQSEIIIDPDGQVRAGTKPALIERLTAHEAAGKFDQTRRAYISTHLSVLQTTHSASIS